MTVAEFDIAGAPLKETLAVVAVNHKTVTHWQRLDNEIFFYWGDPKADVIIPLPGPMKVEDCEGFIKSALSTMDYGREPDCDGHVTKSWRVRDRPKGLNLVGRATWYIAFVVSPHWNEYYK